jgi:hypothetical protein
MFVLLKGKLDEQEKWMTEILDSGVRASATGIFRDGLTLHLRQTIISTSPTCNL